MTNDTTMNPCSIYRTGHSQWFGPIIMTIEDEPFIREAKNNGENLESPQVLQPRHHRTELVLPGIKFREAKLSKR